MPRSPFIHAPFFAASGLEPRGREIVCGFSYLKRINKGAATDLWFSPSLDDSVATRVLNNDPSVLDEFRVEWAAARQFELLQESGNFYVEELDITNHKKAFEYVMKMRAGGYRVTVITLGRYTDVAAHDELLLLDRRLQDEITRLIHMLYLEAQSRALTDENKTLLRAANWRSLETMPHVVAALSENRVFSRRRKDEALPLKEHFFRILDLLPQTHIVHDVAVGLMLPEATKEDQWIYLVQAENQWHAFHQAITTACGSLMENMATMRHMRSHGDRLTPENDLHWRRSALALAA